MTRVASVPVLPGNMPTGLTSDGSHDRTGASRKRDGRHDGVTRAGRNGDAADGTGGRKWRGRGGRSGTDSPRCRWQNQTIVCSIGDGDGRRGRIAGALRRAW